MSDNFAFSTGINYNSVGGTVKYDTTIVLNWDDTDYKIVETKDATPEVLFKVSYLGIPISIKGKTKEIGYITYFGRLGVEPTFAIGSKADIVQGNIYLKDDASNAKLYNKDKTDLNISNINVFNIGWQVGGGIEYSLGGSTALIVEVLYSSNFISMVKNEVTENYNKTDINVKNSMISLKAGIKF
jgi:opacity protein-like surface antigen